MGIFAPRYTPAAVRHASTDRTSQRCARQKSIVRPSTLLLRQRTLQHLTLENEAALGDDAFSGLQSAGDLNKPVRRLAQEHWTKCKGTRLRFNEHRRLPVHVLDGGL